MKTIWKFPFEVTDSIEIEMATGAEILHVDVQAGQPCLWARVDNNRCKEIRRFRVAGTGHPLDDERLAHIGSFFLAGGTLVFHLFERMEDER